MLVNYIKLKTNKMLMIKHFINGQISIKQFATEHKILIRKTQLSSFDFPCSYAFVMGYYNTSIEMPLFELDFINN